jgi:porin
MRPSAASKGSYRSPLFNAQVAPRMFIVTRPLPDNTWPRSATISVAHSQERRERERTGRSSAKPVRRHAPTPTRRYVSSCTVILAWLLLLSRPADAQSAVEPTVIAPPLNVQSSSNPSVHAIESSNLDADFSPGERTTNAPAELDEIYATHDGYLNSTGIDEPLDLLSNPLVKLFQAAGLRFGAANTMLSMEPIGGQSSQSGTAYDIDVISSWTLIGRGSEDTGRLVTTFEYRERIGDQPPSALGAQMGTLVAPASAFNNRREVVRDLYWIQRLFNGRLRILIGRADPSDYVGAIWLANVNNSFVNRSFAANPAVPFPGHGPMLGFSIRPTDLFYVTAGASNAYSRTTLVEINSLFNEWDLFEFGEVGYTPIFAGLGEGRYSVGLWHMDARKNLGLPEDEGVTVIFNQNLGDRLQMFARYAYSDGTLTNVRQIAQAGLGLSGLIGRKDDLTGAAFSVNMPRSSNSRTETVLEVFHRFQVSNHNQFSLGLQLIANPGNATDNEAAGVFYARWRISF